MGSMFESYDYEYQKLAQGISKKISRIPTQTGEAKKTTVNSADRDLEECEQILDAMKLEVHSSPGGASGPLGSKLRQYKTDLSQLKDDLKRAKTALPAGARDDLFQGKGDDLTVTSMDQRTRLLATTDQLNRTTDYITESQRIAEETQEIGANILSDLHGQRETIERSRDRLREADTHLSQSRRIISQMARRMITDKIVMAIIILVLLIVICLIIWFSILKPLFMPDDDSSKKLLLRRY